LRKWGRNSRRRVLDDFPDFFPSRISESADGRSASGALQQRNADNIRILSSHFELAP
jgi:hypothetical protein